MRTSPLNHGTTSAPANHRRASFCVEDLARAWVESLARDGVTIPVLVSLSPEALVDIVVQAVTSRVTLDKVIHAAIRGDGLEPPADGCRECGNGAVELRDLNTGKIIHGEPVQCLECRTDLPSPVLPVKCLVRQLPQIPEEKEIMPGTVTREELAAIYKVSPRTVDRWRRARRVSYKKIGRLVRFDPAVVDAELAEYVVKSKLKGPMPLPLSVVWRNLIDLEHQQ
jgi:hypothetical protein